MLEEISKIGPMLWVWVILGFLLMRYLLGTLDKPKTHERATNKESRFDNATAHEPPEQASSIAQWFEVLEVASTASLDEIKAAYKKKISQYHPDKVAKLGSEFQAIAERKSKQINAAYEFIARRHGN